MVETCSFCKHQLKLIITGAEAYCEKCGFVYAVPTFQVDSTEIGTGSQVASSNYKTHSNTNTSLKGRGNLKTKTRNLENWHNRMRLASVKDKNLGIASTEIEKVATVFNFSNYIKTELYDKFRYLLDQNVTKGKSIATIICALAYMVCIKESVPVSFDSLVNGLGLKKKRVSKIYKLLLKKLPEYIILQKPDLFIQKYAHCLHLENTKTQKVKELAENLYPHLELLSKSGKGPNAFSATLVWCSANLLNEKFNEKQFTEDSKLTTVTIHNKSYIIYKTLFQKSEIVKGMLDMARLEALLKASTPRK